ncbi:MAG: hypothetical protein JWO78_2205 [Micavibrio sp.]|nr:hypothetical protein [Micavibrio sp.]
MPTSYLHKTTNFFTTDGKITRQGLLGSTILGGLYLGLPAYLAIKNIGTIGKAAKSAAAATKDFIADYKAGTAGGISGTDFLKASLAPLKTKKTLKIAGAFTVAAALLVTADHFTSFENENWNRLSHFGVGVGTVGNAAAGASADFISKKRGFWESFGPRLWHKTTDVGAIAIDGTINAAVTTANTAASTVSIFADPEDKEGKTIFAKPLSEKFVTVCVNRSDYSNPVKDAQGSIKWEKKTGPKAEADNRKIPDYISRLNVTAEEFKKSGSDLRTALEKSASGIVIIEPGYIKDNDKIKITEGATCPDLKSKEYKYKAETYLKSQGQGHLPAGPVYRGN